MDIHVIKRNGSHERCHPDKINRLLEWACEGLEARAMDVAMRAQLNLFDRIPTRAILTVLVDAAAGLISVERPAYQYVTARLMLAGLRKEVWGGIVPPSLDYHVRMVHDLGFYADWTVEEFTEAELEQLDAHIDHDRDFQFTAAALNQMKEKYLLQDRVDRRCFETPQFAYMLIAMGLYAKCPDRIRRICAAYDDYTLRRLSIPTPLLAGMRSRINSYASCALIEFGDSLKSIMASLTDCATAITTRYGLGIDAAAIRAIGAPIRGGEAVHSGVIPMLKIMEPVVRGLYQNGVRQGSATVNFQWWHYEMPEILMLKDPGGSHDQRVRHLDYAIAVEGAVFFERSLRRQEVTLFSPHEVPELLASMGRPEFKALYEAAEANPAIRMKRRVDARELLDTLLKQRFNTTRYYVLFADNLNAHVPWLATVRMSNLCMEILTPTIAARYHEDPRAESGICVLSCVNIVETAEEDIPAVCENAVRGLEEMIDIQTYFSPAAENFCKRRRSLGIGLTNVAAYLAKNGLTYDHPDAPNRIARVMEKVQFHLIRTSMELAKERGPCELYHETRWSRGILPIDTYKKSLDAVVTEPLHEDWEWLRGEIAKYGMRHSTLSAQPPVESTSVVQNATNGVEPPTSLVGAKTSKSGDAPFLVPGAGEYHQHYKLAFDYEDNLGFIRCAAAMQKFVCMGISLNFYYNAGKKTVPMELLARELFTAWQLGLHTLYYLKPNDGDKQTVAHEDEHAHAAVRDGSGCDAGGCAL